MKLNAKKRAYVGRPPSLLCLYDATLTLGSNTVKAADAVRVLVLFTRDLALERSTQRRRQSSAKCFFQLRQLRRVRPRNCSYTRL